jgi:DNA (cytosine-5)-methyltransferase 1
MANEQRSRIKTLSLFSGAGGLDIGFHNAGYDIVGCVEIEEHYCKTLYENQKRGTHYSPKTKIHCIDIREFDAREYVGKGIECIIGGPPCQTFSAAGRRSGGVLGTKDARGRLFEAYCDILKILKPKAFVFENVYGLPGASNGGPWREIVAAFYSLGYKLKAEVLDTADYGVPQHRERLIIV